MLQVADRVAVKLKAVGQIDDASGLHVHGELIPVFDLSLRDGFRQSLHEEHRIGVVDGVPVIDAGAGLRQDAGDARVLQAVHRVLAAGAAAEVLSGHHVITRLHFLREVLHARIILKGVLRHLFRVCFCKVLVMIDQVGIHIVREYPRASCFRCHLLSPLVPLVFAGFRSPYFIRISWGR